jgi:shikimate kinase
MMEDVSTAPRIASHGARVLAFPGRRRLAPELAKHPPLVVELVGAWGAGKSSLVRSLSRRDGSVRAAPPVWSLPTPLLAIGGLHVIATFVRLLRSGRAIPWKTGRQLIRLRALYHHLDLLRRKRGRIVVVEDGPALILSWLRDAAARPGEDADMAPWWRSVVKRWAKTVDIVVFLDAPDRVLARRVLARTQENPFKDKPEPELTEVLERSREAYVRVLADLPAHEGPRVLTFRTDRQSIAEITDDLLVAFANESNGR